MPHRLLVETMAKLLWSFRNFASTIRAALKASATRLRIWSIVFGVTTARLRAIGVVSVKVERLKCCCLTDRA